MMSNIFTDLFIRRPVLAIVVNLIIVIAGLKQASFLVNIVLLSMFITMRLPSQNDFTIFIALLLITD